MGTKWELCDPAKLSSRETETERQRGSGSDRGKGKRARLESRKLVQRPSPNLMYFSVARTGL